MKRMLIRKAYRAPYPREAPTFRAGCGEAGFRETGVVHLVRPDPMPIGIK